MKKLDKCLKYLLSTTVLSIAVAVVPAYTQSKTVMKTEVVGASGDVLANIQTRLKLDGKDIDGPLTQHKIRRFAIESLKSVREAASPYGYFKPKVTYSVFHDGNVWTVRYNVRLGEPVKITEIDVRVSGPGAQNKKINKYIKNFPLHKGDILVSSQYTAARDKFFDIANNQGYIKATPEVTKVLVNTKTHSAVIRIHLDTGERYYFGDLYFNKSPYSDAFMNRFNVFNQNRPFSSKELLQYQQDMNASRYFSQVVVIPKIADANNNRVPIHASVVPPKDHRYSFGLGYGTFTGPRVTAGMTFNRLTANGHAFDAKLKASSVLTGFAAKYLIPGEDPLTEQWFVGANFSEFQPKEGTSRSKTLSGGYTKKMGHWTLDANLTLLFERFIVNNTPPPRNAQELYPTLRLSYMKADNIVRPQWARSMHVSVRGASREVLSGSNFVQGNLAGKIFMTPLSFMHIIARAELGYTIVENLDDFPLSLRYFAGGLNSIRGFPESSIGPGRYLGTASLEYRNHITENISGAVFYDIGTATNHFGDPPLSRGAGVGLVYESVVGPIKLYYARALSKKGQPHSIEFSIGPEF